MQPRMSSESRKDSFSAWERHGQTVIAALILGAILWVGKSITELSGTMGVVLNRLEVLERQITAMDERFDRYQTKSEARSQVEAQALRDRLIHSRIDTLEKKIPGID